jgi:1-acyl-sn-glycerol-3-phosphate acyltransferase
MTAVESFLVGNGPISRLAYRLTRAIVVGWVRIYLRASIEGREHVPRAGAFVLAPVHRSYVDTPIAASVTRRRLRFMGKDTLWKYRFSAWVLSSLGGFPVTRGTADRQALQRCIHVLESGEPLVLFPEGERKSGPVVQPLFDGAVYVAVKAGVPIVPVGIGGSERVMPKGKNFVYPRKVHVIVGEAIPAPVSDGGRLPRATLREHSALLHAELQRLFDLAQERAGLEPGVSSSDRGGAGDGAAQ